MLKLGESPLVRAAINALGTKTLFDDQADAEQAVRESALEDLMGRQQEARRMAPVRRGLRGHGGFATNTTDYAGAGSLRDYDDAIALGLPFEKGGSADPELTKEALNLMGGAKLLTGKALQGGGLISKGFGKVVGAAGRGLEGAGGAISKGLTPTGRLLNAGMSETEQFAKALKPGLGSRIGGFLQGAGQKAQQAGQVAASAGHNVAAGGAAMAQGALKPAAQAASQAASASKPWLSTGTKLKAMGAAGALGAGYVGYKGLQAGRDYMAQPAGQHQQDYVQQGVNQYGY